MKLLIALLFLASSFANAMACDVSLSAPQNLFQNVRVEVQYATIDGEAISLQIPISEIADPEMNAGGVSGRLKRFPYVLIQGAQLYQTSAGDPDIFVPFAVKELSTGRLNKTSKELLGYLDQFTQAIPGLLVTKAGRR